MKRLFITGLATIMLCGLGLNDPNLASAASNVSYMFEPSSINSSHRIVETTHYHENRGSAEDTITIAVSRTKSFTGSISTSYEASAILAEVGIAAEVGFGESTTYETSVTYTCAPNKMTTCEYGSARVTAEGALIKYQGGEQLTGKQANVNYSYGSFSRKREAALN